MELKLDHIFIMVSEGAPEADQLVQFGLTEGEPNIHAGQGTSNRRFFFQNFMLEFVWIHDVKEVRNETTRPTLLWERWENRKEKSPFGICLQPENEAEEEFPFNCWGYNPVYLPAGKSFLISNSSKNLDEPMIFITPFNGRQSFKKNERIVHYSRDFQEITSVCIHTPEADSISDAFRYVEGMKNISVKKARKHHLELEFNSHKEGKSKKFSPQLPLLINW